MRRKKDIMTTMILAVDKGMSASSVVMDDQWHKKQLYAGR